MDFQILFNIAIGIIIALIAGLGGWILGRITKALDTLDNDVRGMPHKYVSKEDYRDDIRELRNLSQRIFDKLEGKADKP